MLDAVLEVGINSFLLLFVTLDPISVTPMFAARSAHLSETARAALLAALAVQFMVDGLTAVLRGDVQ